MRDSQRQKVYDWEDNLPKGKLVPFAEAQAYVDRVWAAEGLSFPPKVEPIAAQTKRWAGRANRLYIQLQPVVSEKTILHEMAHSLTGDVDGATNMHNEEFVGVYMRLLEKFLGINIFYLWFTADKAGIKFNKFAKPLITDGQESYR